MWFFSCVLHAKARAGNTFMFESTKTSNNTIIGFFGSIFCGRGLCKTNNNSTGSPDDLVFAWLLGKAVLHERSLCKYVVWFICTLLLKKHIDRAMRYTSFFHGCTCSARQFPSSGECGYSSTHQLLYSNVLCKG